MPTVVTVINTITGKHYTIKIPPITKDVEKVCTISLLSYSDDHQEIIETFIEKYEANESATVSEILEKGRKIVNSYRS